MQGARTDRGSHLPVDGFHAEANVALRSLRESVAGEATAEVEPDDAPPSEPPRLRLAELRSGPTLKRKATNATASSYRGHVAVDPKAAASHPASASAPKATKATRLAPILDRGRFVLP